MQEPTHRHPYESLTPDVVVSAVEALGHRCDGRILALNSYENRVYQVGREDTTPVVLTPAPLKMRRRRTPPAEE